MSKKRKVIVIIVIVLFLIAIYISNKYYNGKYVISFETGTSEEILNKYVERNSKVGVPKEPIKEGYIFVEWQYEGETFDFETEIKKDMVLTAKWKKIDYITISFDSQSDSKIENLKLIKGESIKELPIVEKTGYEFIGWYMDEELYIDQNIFEDVTLVAKYEKKDN